MCKETPDTVNPHVSEIGQVFAQVSNIKSCHHLKHMFCFSSALSVQDKRRSLVDLHPLPMCDLFTIAGALGRGLSYSCALSPVTASGAQVVELFQVWSYMCPLWVTQEVGVHLSTVAEHHGCWPASHARDCPAHHSRTLSFSLSCIATFRL